jgi:hypothetical protein
VSETDETETREYLLQIELHETPGYWHTVNRTAVTDRFRHRVIEGWEELAGGTEVSGIRVLNITALTGGAGDVDEELTEALAGPQHWVR